LIAQVGKANSIDELKPVIKIDSSSHEITWAEIEDVVSEKEDFGIVRSNLQNKLAVIDQARFEHLKVGKIVSNMRHQLFSDGQQPITNRDEFDIKPLVYKDLDTSQWKGIGPRQLLRLRKLKQLELDSKRSTTGSAAAMESTFSLISTKSFLGDNAMPKRFHFCVLWLGSLAQNRSFVYRMVVEFDAHPTTQQLEWLIFVC
jgi:hypothetical protein